MTKMSLLSRYESLGEAIDPTFRPRPALRINTLRVDESEALEVLRAKGVKLQRIPGVPCGYWYESSFSLGATPEFLQGWYYLQEAASQLPVLALDPKPGERVLDMAAAPGSKTTQAAQLMADEGVIAALDDDAVRLQSLRNNLERMGISCVACYKKDARFADDLGVVFDKVLLDAPCSGNFCIEEDYFTTRTLQDIRGRSRVQKELLKAAYKCLRPGGVLVYSTCSLEPEEDELVVDWFLGRFKDMRLVPTGLRLGSSALTDVLGEELDESLHLAKRLWPSRSGTQGFFVAKLVKDDA